MILVDTSVWVQHFQEGVPALSDALEDGEVVMHPFVLGELACGNLRQRREALDLLGQLPALPPASDREALALIEWRKLMGRGIGYVDVHLLAAVLLESTVRIWTLDRRLSQVATDLVLAYTPG